MCINMVIIEIKRIKCNLFSNELIGFFFNNYVGIIL